RDGRPRSCPAAQAGAPFGSRAMMAQIRRLVWYSWRPIAERAARAYVAGPELADALRVCHGLARRGTATSICPWDGEGDTPRQVADWYLAALAGLVGAGAAGGAGGGPVWLPWVKAPAPGSSRGVLGEAVETVRPDASGIHFD